jgi:hypothetical protein
MLLMVGMTGFTSDPSASEFKVDAVSSFGVITLCRFY